MKNRQEAYILLSKELRELAKCDSPAIRESVQKNEGRILTGELGGRYEISFRLEGRKLIGSAHCMNTAKLGFIEESVDLPSEDIPAGLVVELDTAQSELPKGSDVGYFVSTGPAPRSIPDDLVGLSCDEAVARLTELRLTSMCSDEYSDSVLAAEVIRTEPAAGAEVPVTDPVTVWVSLGPEPVEVPSVIGSTVDGAESTLTAGDLRVCDGVDGPPNGTVIGQNPIAGELALPGSCVELSSR